MGATVAVSVLSLALITGCSDEGSDDSKDSANSGSSSSSSSSPTAAAKAYNAAELEKLLLAEGEIEGYKVTSGDDTLPKSKSVLKNIDKAECEPVAYAMAALPPGDTDATASNTVTEAPPTDDPSKSLDELAEGDFAEAFNLTATYVGLSSYEGDGAEKAFKAVSDGVKACSGGFGFTADGTNTKITKITSEKASGAGDESVAFAVDSGADGESGTFHTEVVRHGSTIATYYSVNFALMSSGKPYDVPAAVIDAQAAKVK